MSNIVKVKIINFRDPDQIFIKYLEGEKSRKNEIETKKVQLIERKLFKHCKNAPRINHPKFGEIYGCYISLWKKWVRGQFISKSSSNGSTFFCMDQGMHKSKITEIVNIPDEMKFEKFQTYYKVSLGLIPKNTNQWHQNVIEKSRDILSNENMIINFLPFLEESTFFIGDLIIFIKDEHFSLSEKLISLGLATNHSTDFNTIFKMLHDQDVGSSMTFDETDSNSKNPQKMPDNLIIHGRNLKPFLKNINDCNFQHLLKKKLSYKNGDLNVIQKLIWPQISDGKHTFVITSSQDCLTSFYLLPLINKLLKCPKSDQLGSTAIIFTSCSSRVDEIAIQCDYYAKNNISVIKAVGMCKDILIQLMNGYDVLITTPSAFIRLINYFTYSIIDKNRLNHVVFENFDSESLKVFDKQLNGIMKILYNELKLPQTIIASKTCSIILKTKILNRLPAADTVKCMDNYLDAAAFVGLSITLEISADSEDKINKFLKNDFDGYKKNLIVCKNNETMSVLDKLASKAIKCEDPKIAENWDASSINNILIINDAILNDSIIKNVDNLIHYDLPFNMCLAVTASDQFSMRFKVFHNEIYKRLDSQEEVVGVLRTKVMLSNDNVRQFEELINLLIGRNLLKASENVIEKIYEANEAAKSMKNISLCPNLLQFGDCTKKFNCINRHRISEQDQPSIHLEVIKNFITFDLISQQGPTSFIIKIREYYDNKWISCAQSNEYIQQKLDIDMQRYCHENSNALALTLNEGIVGEIYAKYDNKLGKWIRGKMIKRKSIPIVELNLLDCLPDVPSSQQSLQIKCHEKKLVKLPEEFTKLNPLLYKLQVMNLVPLDGEKFYSKTDADRLTKVIDNIHKNVKFSASIKTIIGDVIFVRNIEAKNDKQEVIFRLTDAHMKLGISEIDDNVCKRIMELSTALNISKRDPVNINQDKIMVGTENKAITIKNLSNQKVSYPKNWKQLKYNTAYPIIVKEYISPYSFFAVLINHENLTLKKNLSAIEESHDHMPLINLKINECCLFYSNNRYLRAIILNINLPNGQIEVLLVDYGEIQKCDEKSLFKIPKDFLSFNFQVIHCSMLGICPKYNMKFWPGLQRSAVHKLISTYNGKSLKMFVVNDDQRKHQFSDIGVSSYNVQLYDDESKYYLHKLAVRQGIASECAEYAKDFYESPLSDHDDSVMDVSSSSSDIFSDSKELCVSNLVDILKISESSINEELNYGSGTNSVDFADNDSAECSSRMSAHEMNLSSDSIESITKIASIKSSVTASAITPASSLKNIFKLSHIEWKQTNFMVYLLISANDCLEYGLKINETSLDVVIKYQDNKIERNLIQFYGSVKPQLCSHELVGINIVVRLAKKLCGQNWLRLTMSKEKSIYIRFNSENSFCNLDVNHNQRSYDLKPDLSDDQDDEWNINEFESDDSSDNEF